MVSSRWNSLAALALASAGLAGLAAAADEQVAPTEPPIVVRARVVAQDGEVVPLELEAKPRIAFIVEGADESSQYWIGVQLEPPTDILKQHLKLEGGMVAVHVFEDSPAAKGGLQANDIIIKAGDGYVKEPGDLLKSVGDAKGKELTLVLIRGGKEQTLKVVPAKRPQEAAPQPALVAETEEKEAVQKLEAALNIYWKRRTTAVAGEVPAVDVLRLRPGVVAGPGGTHLGLPKDVTVTITKAGVNPAKIVVKKEGKEYEATEDNLNELPADLRGFAHLVRSGGGHAFAYQAQAAPATASKKAAIYKSVTVPTPLSPATAEAPKVYRYHVEAKHAAGEVDSKLDQILKIISQKEDSSVSELRKEVQQLRKELESLRQEKK
ncbi:MAG: PDZ domain-containing protein [Pirellulaceae bacterium]